MRRRRRYYPKFKVFVISVSIVLIFSIAAGLYTFFASTAPVSAAAPQQGGQLELWPKWRDILFSGIPGLSTTAADTPAVKVVPELTAQQVLRGMLLFFTNVDIKDPRSLFHAEIPLSKSFKTGTPSVSAMSLPNFPKFDPNSLLKTGKPLVGIYHTHTAEAFIPSSGVSHKPGGQRGDIVDVGTAMAKQLEKHGIGTVHSNNIHDYPSFMKAYGPSEGTARQMLTDNPSLQMIFDIHRDADKRENSTATINGVEVAKITIVVARGQQDLVQPHWQQNHAFAKLIDAKLNQHFPGISRGIQLVDWRYNQHLHPRALLIEVGCQENSKEEASRSMEMLADVLAEIISENNT